jgi:hypothetical protein
MKLLPAFLLISLMLASCNEANKEQTSDNNIDAARNFIRAALDGKFKEARDYMIQDSVNMNYLEIAERSYRKADAATRNGYRSSSINIHEVIEPFKDSISVVIFSNSFKNDHDTLKVLRSNGKWLVDLKYLFEHDSDSTLKNTIKKDSLSQ